MEHQEALLTAGGSRRKGEMRQQAVTKHRRGWGRLCVSRRREQQQAAGAGKSGGGGVCGPELRPLLVPS